MTSSGAGFERGSGKLRENAKKPCSWDLTLSHKDGVRLCGHLAYHPHQLYTAMVPRHALPSLGYWLFSGCASLLRLLPCLLHTAHWVTSQLVPNTHTHTPQQSDHTIYTYNVRHTQNTRHTLYHTTHVTHSTYTTPHHIHRTHVHTHQCSLSLSI